MGLLEYGKDWLPAKATVKSLRKKFFPQLDGYISHTAYVVTFSYIAEGRKRSSRYTTSTPPEVGHSFDIFYDPKHPDRNTGVDNTLNPWVKWVVWLIMAAVFLTAYWLWGDQSWFKYPTFSE
jgi:hypothetical protein